MWELKVYSTPASVQTVRQANLLQCVFVTTFTVNMGYLNSVKGCEDNNYGFSKWLMGKRAPQD